MQTKQFANTTLFISNLHKKKQLHKEKRMKISRLQNQTSTGHILQILNWTGLDTQIDWTYHLEQRATYNQQFLVYGYSL